MPKVSVIIATHSRPQLLPRAVESAFAAGVDIEVIVVDDASTDETAEVCRNLKNIKYVRAERNQRTAGARNLGIVASAGEYLTFLDDDDLRLSGSLDKQVKMLDENAEAGFVYGQAIFGDAEYRPTDTPPQPVECPQGDIFWELLRKIFIPCGSVVFRKECVYRVGLLEKTLNLMDDWDMWIRIAELYPALVIEEPVFIWRTAAFDSQQGSSQIYRMWSNAFAVYEKRWLSLPRARQAPKAQRQAIFQECTEWMANMILWEAFEALKNKHFDIARRSFAAAVKINPKLALHPKTIINAAKTII